MASEGEAVEVHGRYCRFGELLGSGAFKKVYKGVNTEEGIEVAWAIIELDRAGACCAATRSPAALAVRPV